jgi:hypothetical protein
MDTEDFSNVLSGIAVADEKQLDMIRNAYDARRSFLAELRAVRVCDGAKVTTRGLRPKYLNGLTGEVTSVRGNKADLLLTDLDEIYKLVGTKYGPPYGVPTEEFTLHGVPLTCFDVA